MAEHWLSRHGTTLIAVGAALVLALVALMLWNPPWKSHNTPAADGQPSNAGWEIRYNATIALARRGSSQTRLDILEEMLDEPTQRANFRTKLADGKEAVDEQAAYQSLDAALDATLLYQEKTKDPKVAEELKPAIVKLTESPHRAIRDKAQRLLQELT